MRSKDKLKTIDGRIDAQRSWCNLLTAETVHLDELGLNSGITVIELTGDAEVVIARRRALRILQPILSPTDRCGTISRSRIAVLHSPTESFVQFVRWSGQINKMLSEQDITTAAAFAQRRSDESLLDTFARADAELDRLIFRSELASGRLTIG